MNTAVAVRLVVGRGVNRHKLAVERVTVESARLVSATHQYLSFSSSG